MLCQRGPRRPLDGCHFILSMPACLSETAFAQAYPWGGVGRLPCPGRLKQGLSQAPLGPRHGAPAVVLDRSKSCPGPPAAPQCRESAGPRGCVHREPTPFSNLHLGPWVSWAKSPTLGPVWASPRSSLARADCADGVHVAGPGLVLQAGDGESFNPRACESLGFCGVEPG